MNKNTLLLLVGFAVVGAGAWYLTRGQKQTQGDQQSDAYFAAQIAQAQAAAQMQQAQSAEHIAELQKPAWYTPFMAGLGQGTSGFLSSLPGIFK